MRIVIISDIDDTIKITRVLSPGGSLCLGNGVIGFYTNHVFFGMTDLYKYFVSSASDDERAIYYVTAAPGFIIEFGRHTLHSYQFPFRHTAQGIEMETFTPPIPPPPSHPETPFTKRSKKEAKNYERTHLYGKRFCEPKLQFKIDKITELIEKESESFPGTRFILVGDNGELDSDVFEGVIENLSSQLKIFILGVFIHYVYSAAHTKSKKSIADYLRLNQTPWFTSVDLGLQFLKLGVITPVQFELLLKASLTQIHKELSGGTSFIYRDWMTGLREFFSNYLLVHLLPRLRPTSDTPSTLLDHFFLYLLRKI